MGEERPRLLGVLETVLYYTDHGRSRSFYGDVLGMRLIAEEPGRHLFYRAGESVFLLFQIDDARGKESPPAHGANGPSHTCFVVRPDQYEPWKRHLEAAGVPVIDEITWERGLTFYFRDPDGNVLEIANADIWPR